MIPDGTQLGHYTITKQIGAGGMGAVYEAVDERLHRRVAIKVLPPRLAVDSDSLQRFRQEARAASALNHPNIVHIYAIDETVIDGQRVPYIAMELIDGETLRVKLTSGATPRQLLGPLLQVTEAMAKAHERGIVHRDLKPENIMIHRDGYAKIVDFGLAKLLEPHPVPIPNEITEPLLTAAGSVRGTAAYMSPEQVRGESADARSDVFTLGCILYEIAARQRPFEADNVIDMLWNIAHAEPEPLADPEWNRIAMRCLAKDPEERYANAGELARELRTLGSRQVVESPGRRGKTPTRRLGGSKTRRLLFAIPALVLLALIAAYALRPARRTIDSVAVLPFRNTKADPEVDYITDGVTESLIAALSETTPLRVMSRASVFRLKGSPPLDAGRALQVDAVLNGEIEPRGQQLIVRAELIDVADGARLWGNRYETEPGAVLAVQENISREVAARLSQRPGEQRSSTDDPEAYRLYLKGRYHWNKRNADGLSKAVEQFRAALDRDPSYARAWVGLADSYALMEQYAGVPSRETCGKAKAAAQRAAELEPSLAEPHATLGLLLAHCEWKWAESEAEFRKAIELNPKYATTHHWYALHLAYRGQFDRALVEARRAQELDPLSLIANNALAVVQAYARDYDAVLEQTRKNLEMDPAFVVTHMWIGRAKREQKKYDEALPALQEAVRLSHGRSLETLADLAYAYAVSGRRDEALKILDRLAKPPYSSASAHYHLAAIHAGLGDRARALDELDRAVDAHSWFLVQIHVDPMFDSLRSDPRFQRIAERIMPAASRAPRTEPPPLPSSPPSPR